MTAPNNPADQPDVPALLARAAAAGQDAEAAWRELVALYGRRVYALARARRLGEEAAEEVAQSVFVTVAQQVRSGASRGYEERGRFESWLFRIAVNRVRDEMRRRKRALADNADPADLDASIPSSPNPHDPGESESHVRSLRDLRAAMALLPDADREVVELRHHGGLSFKQIADTLDEPLGTVLARHHRALRKLKDIMSRSGTPAPSARAGDLAP